MDMHDDLVLRMHRVIKAPPDAVFRAWLNPDSLRAWFVPNTEFLCTSARTDPQVGGRYDIEMRAPDGEVHRVGGVYREIVADERLVFTWAWQSTPERESLVTIEVRPVEGGTELALTHARFADAVARDRHEHGWTGCLAALVAHMERQHAAGAAA